MFTSVFSGLKRTASCSIPEKKPESSCPCGPPHKLLSLEEGCPVLPEGVRDGACTDVRQPSTGALEARRKDAPHWHPLRAGPSYLTSPR